jgi:hypothetical protein
MSVDDDVRHDEEFHRFGKIAIILLIALKRSIRGIN